MKIIFSPSKEMNLENPIDKDWKLSEYNKTILNEYIKDGLKEKLKINDSIFETVKSYISEFDNKVSYKAYEMYNGLSFRYLDVYSLDNIAKKYLDQNLLICSALYGPINADKLVKPYRLDFHSRLKVDDSTLKTFWKDKYDEHLSPKDLVLNLASKEFAEIFNQSKYHWINFEFYEENNGNLKSHSTISKKGRGYILRQFAIKNIQSVEDIFNTKFENYDISKDSTKDNIIFIKKI